MDWLQDDGINLPMINDHIRNRFYYHLLESTVKNRDCIEIGFGTGLLTMMALRHGAKHVTAYEKDTDRYRLGLEIVHKCGMEQKITLLNKKYDYSMREDANTLVFSEIMSDNVWSEGLWHCLPRQPDADFFPAFYQVEITAFELPGSNIEKCFDPGVNIDHTFRTLLDTKISQQIESIDVESFIQKHAVQLYIKCLEQKFSPNLIGGYRLNVSTCMIDYLVPIGGVVRHTPIDFDQPWIDLEVTAARPSLLIARAGFGYQDKILYLDETHCWNGKVMEPYVALGQRSLSFNHNLVNGAMRRIGERHHETI